MKKENGYWVDDNNNRWDTNLYTKEQAENSGLTYCMDCTDCTDCTGCTYCRDCRNCTGCTGCTDCRDCRSCRDCTGCTGCTDCMDCRNCTGCTYCRNCRGFKTQPQQYMTPRMGRECRINWLTWNVDRIEVTCGCFRGTIDELEAKVTEVHGGTDHFKEYMKQISIFRMLTK